MCALLFFLQTLMIALIGRAKTTEHVMIWGIVTPARVSQVTLEETVHKVKR